MIDNNSVDRDCGERGDAPGLTNWVQEETVNTGCGGCAKHSCDRVQAGPQDQEKEGRVGQTEGQLIYLFY